MHIHFPSLRLIVVALSLILLYSCKKTDSSISDPPDNRPPAITPVGTPVGNPVSKNIGAAGGTLTSPDGRLEINIPAGALSSNTDISIQPVTNEAPGGIGLSYDLLPDGTKFSKPVTLTFHYTDAEVPDNIPYFLFIAYQDSARAWRADFIQRDFDTVAKTVSLDVNHFTIFSLVDALPIQADAYPLTLIENQTSLVLVQESVFDNKGRLTDKYPVPINSIDVWKVEGVIGGNPTDGTITSPGPGSFFYKYTAPSFIDKRRTVRVSVVLKDRPITRIYKKGKEIQLVKVERGVDITLEPNEIKYHVSISLEDPNIIGMDRKQVYFDRASFDVTCFKIPPDRNFLKDAGSNFKNQAPLLAPSVLKYDVGDDKSVTIAWIPDIYGQIDVKGVKVTESYDDEKVSMQLIHENATFPGDILTTGSNTINHPPKLFGDQNGTPSIIDFKLKDEEQIQHIGNGGTNLTIIITPIK